MTHAEQAPARIWVMTHVCFDAPQEGATEYVRVDIPREQVAAAIMRCSLATGHGDTLEDLLGEIVPQVIELMNKIGACRRALIAMVDRWGPGTEGADRRMWVEACRALGRFTPRTEDEIASALPSVYRWERETPEAATPQCPQCWRQLGILRAMFTNGGRDEWLCEECRWTSDRP